jgi:hypothetical protein
MTPQEKQHLTRIVNDYARMNAEIQSLKWDQKALAESAWDKAGVKPRVVKQLAKESAWDDVRREEQRQLEESLDECRAALGMLADLPLGQAATQPRANGRAAANGAAANGHANGANGKADAKRGPGRPRGSRNRPKSGDWSRPPQADPPDLPDAA